MFISGLKRLKPNNPHLDLWKFVLETVQELPHNSFLVAKVPAHQCLTEIENDLEAWAVIGNSAADSAAKSANLARPLDVWELWSKHSQQVDRLGYIGDTIRGFMVQVSKRWLQQRFSSRDGNEQRQPDPRVGRIFPILWEPNGELQHVGGIFHQRFGFLADKFLRWWNVNTNASDGPRWISFMHLYLDWQMTFGHPGVLLVNGQWCNGATVGAAPEGYNHNLRTKWWRLLMQQFYRDAGIRVGRATLPPFSAVVYQFVGATSIPWPSHRIACIDRWIAERMKGQRGNGSVFKTLPLCDLVPGFDL